MAHNLNVEDLQGLRYAAVHIYKCEENIMKKFKTHSLRFHVYHLYITTTNNKNKNNVCIFIHVFIYNGNVLNEVRKGPLMTICAEHKTRLNVSTSLLLIAACKMSAAAHKTAASITFLQPS